MLSLRGKQIPVQRFLDGTLRLTLNEDMMPVKSRETIIWQYESDDELVTLIFLKRHLQEHGCKHVKLFLPYLPNARMDRVKSDNEVFTLKHFCWVINSLHFQDVTIFDPHSSMGIALLNKVRVIWPTQIIQSAIDAIGDDVVVCYPDRGAYERYSEMVNAPNICFEKRRDWKSREIIKHEMLENDIDLTDKKVLIVDDICSSGGTLLGVAHTLKSKYNVKAVYAYVSHCENCAVNSKLLASDDCDGLYTTASIYKENHPKIHVLDAPWNF